MNILNIKQVTGQRNYRFGKKRIDFFPLHLLGFIAGTENGRATVRPTGWHSD